MRGGYITLAGKQWPVTTDLERAEAEHEMHLKRIASLPIYHYGIKTRHTVEAWPSDGEIDAFMELHRRSGETHIEALAAVALGHPVTEDEMRCMDAEGYRDLDAGNARAEVTTIMAEARMEAAALAE